MNRLNSAKMQSAIEKYLESERKLPKLVNPFFDFYDRLAGKQNILNQSSDNLVSGNKFNSIPNSFYSRDLLRMNEVAKNLTKQIENFEHVQKAFRFSGEYLFNPQLIGKTITERLLTPDYENKEGVEDLNGIEKGSQIILLNEIEKVKSIIRNVYRDNDELFKVSPRDFEFLIAELLRGKNFNVELTKQTRDGGFDIIALQQLSGFQNKYLVECKRNSKSNPVDIGVVRNLGYVIDKYNANKGIIFTSSYFSPDAYKEKEVLSYRLDLKNGMDVLGWVNEYMEMKA